MVKENKEWNSARWSYSGAVRPSTFHGKSTLYGQKYVHPCPSYSVVLPHHTVTTKLEQGYVGVMVRGAITFSPESRCVCVCALKCISDMKYLITKCFTKPCILLAPRRWSSFEFESESCRVVIKNTNHLLPSSAPAPAECTAEFPLLFFQRKNKNRN